MKQRRGTSRKTERLQTNLFRSERFFVTLLLAVHSALLCWAAIGDSFAWTEVGLLPSGLYHWTHGSFDLFRVNPPLPRMLATAPLLVTEYELPTIDVPLDHRIRSEWEMGREFIALNGVNSFRLLTISRIWSIPISLIGGGLVYIWSRRIFGAAAAKLSLTLWCFSPNVLAHGHLISGDLAAAVTGMATVYLFCRWLEGPDSTYTLRLGLSIGIALLTKLTWLLLLAILPLLFLVFFRRNRTQQTDLINSNISFLNKSWQLTVALAFGILVLNAGYGYQGSFRQLGSYDFVSDSLRSGDLKTGETSVESSLETEAYTNQRSNRFRNSWLGRLPVPLPEDFVLGVDLQKWDISRHRWSYLRGRWRDHGWWYYYLYGFLVKVPLGTLGLLGIATWTRLWQRKKQRSFEEGVLLTTIGALLVLISFQTGLSKHFRYALPLFPLLFVWVGQVSCWSQAGKRWRRLVILLLLGASLTSSAAHSPYWISYFNAAAGGPKNGHSHLLSSNIDWGQDLLRLQQWCQQHPEVSDLKISYHLHLISPRVVGLDDWTQNESTITSSNWSPGWYAISVNHLRSRSGAYKRFLELEPVDRIGYSIYIYFLEAEMVFHGEKKMSRRDAETAEE